MTKKSEDLDSIAKDYIKQQSSLPASSKRKGEGKKIYTFLLDSSLTTIPSRFGEFLFSHVDDSGIPFAVTHNGVATHTLQRGSLAWLRCVCFCNWCGREGNKFDILETLFIPTENEDIPIDTSDIPKLPGSKTISEMNRQTVKLESQPHLAGLRTNKVSGSYSIVAPRERSNYITTRESPPQTQLPERRQTSTDVIDPIVLAKLLKEKKKL